MKLQLYHGKECISLHVSDGSYLDICIEVPGISNLRFVAFLIMVREEQQ
jgi:hypothetical protein